MAKIGLRYGHSINCPGAVGYVEEVEICRSVYKALVNLLPEHTIVVCNSDARSEEEELKAGVTMANSNSCDYYITIHANAFSQESANGTEIWLYDDKDAVMNTWARCILAGMEELGFYNRGIQYLSLIHI